MGDEVAVEAGMQINIKKVGNFRGRRGKSGVVLNVPKRHRSTLRGSTWRMRMVSSQRLASKRLKRSLLRTLEYVAYLAH
jgi:hypothetical protein